LSYKIDDSLVWRLCEFTALKGSIQCTKSSWNRVIYVSKSYSWNYEWNWV